MGKVGLYLKISLLAGALFIVVFIMKGVSKEKVESAFAALGIEPGAAGQPGFQPGGTKLGEGEVRKTLCQTRVHAIRFPDGTALVEKKNGMKLDWTAEESGNSRSLGYLEVEKWFSAHCQFAAKPVGPASEVPLEPSNEPQPYVTIEFIDKSVWEIHRAGQVFFSQSDPSDRFFSPDLEQAMLELRILAGFQVDSGGG